MKTCLQRKYKVKETGGRVYIGALFGKQCDSRQCLCLYGSLNATEPVRGGPESWNADSRATEHLAPEATELVGYNAAVQGNLVDFTDCTFVTVQRYGRLETELQQTGGIITAMLEKMSLTCHP